MKYLASEIAKIVGGTLRGEDREVSSVVTDSRGSVAGTGGVFVAMRGVNHDSHKYVAQMAQRGVEVFIVERDVEGVDGATFIKVDRAIDALQRLATHHRSQFRGVVVGVTGSNGKSTVKEWVAQLAPEGVKIFRSPRSYNSQLGVALSLLMIEGDEAVAVIEAGISQVGEMERLERMIRPEIGVITSIGDAHQEGFESVEQKVAEKFKLFVGAERVIYSSDYEELLPQVMYGGGAAEFIDAAEFEAADMGDVASRRNSQVVAALYHALGFARPNLNAVTPLAMRLELIEGLSGSLVLNDSYNNDINSLSIALDSLRSVASGRAMTVILSDILQSGMSGAELYGRVAEALLRAGVDRLICIGREISHWSSIFECEVLCYSSVEELLSRLGTVDYSGCAILIKGNRESHFERLSHALARQSHTTTLEVDLDAMIHNLNHYRSQLTRGERITAMVKASSYGAGDVEIAQALQHQGVDYLAVAFADEGARLRWGGITMPIIVLNADDGSFAQMVDQQLEPEIYSIASLRSFAAAVSARGEQEYPIHIKLDTGMHRLGFMEGGIAELLSELDSLRGVVRVATIFSHLAIADMGDDGAEATRRQIEIYDRMSQQIMQGVGYSVIRHLANSAAIEAYPEARFDMCRLGIGLYGYESEGLRVVSTLKSRVVQIREIAKGERVGYGGMGVAERVTRVATVPIGYADGLDRHLGCGAWSVLIGGERAPIIGRICMDSCMVDVTNIASAAEGDEVVIFSPAEGNTAADMAAVLGTISYEVLTSVSSRVKRIYLKE